MDRREEILARLAVVAAGISGVVTAVRNSVGLSDDKRPAIDILDADEVSAPALSSQGKGPQLVTMTPEIYIMVAETPENLGPAINAIRASVIKAILEDTDLQNLTGDNGSIRYEGCATGLSRGRSMEGEMGASIAFTYPFFLSEL